MKKNILLLFFVITCSQYIHAYDEYVIDESKITEYEKMVFNAKLLQLEKINKEIAHLGSEEPIMTNVRLGLLMTGIGTVIAIISSIQNYKNDTAKTTGGLVAGSGLFFSLGSGIISDVNYKFLLNHQRTLTQDLNNINSNRIITTTKN
jgi:hypothetical protein